MIPENGKAVLPNKTYTKMGSPIESNLPKIQHDILTNMLSEMEILALKQSGGKITLLDLYKQISEGKIQPSTP